MPSSRNPIIPCEISQERSQRIQDLAEALKSVAPTLISSTMTEEEFWASGIFQAAIEKLRGIRAATTSEKRGFITTVLDYMREKGSISDWSFTGAGERHDYQIKMPGGKLCIVETKGCLDGNNTNIFERPPQADEFIIWSLCQNPGSDPRHNAWSGIHTRLGPEIIHRQQKVDGVVIWDMLCGSIRRPCPKLLIHPTRITNIGTTLKVPPPCIYLFPRSIPDPRNNPCPPAWRLENVELLQALVNDFKGEPSDVVEVFIEARMKEANTQRRTRFFRKGEEFSRSNWNTISRARRL
ncbi:MAG: hypothetical protein ACE5EK_01155 [Nitrospinales bacterium]